MKSAAQNNTNDENCRDNHMAKHPSPLTLSPYQRDSSTPPFHGDIFERRDVANKMTRFVNRLSGAGAVVAIDAPWGTGKTWFGTNWADLLREDGHKVAFVNAFEQDYADDPFLIIAAELSELLDADAKGGFIEKAADVGKAILPIAAKVALNVVTKTLTGADDLSGTISNAVDSAGKESEEFAKKWIERKLEGSKKEKESLAGFRKALGDAAEREEKPVVVFVDELDRCRPDFAVRLVERIKHFFETPNVVFVLLINRKQLANAIEGVYGSGTDGNAYLSKFVHFDFVLPAVRLRNYISTILSRFEVRDDSDSTLFANKLELWTQLASLSPRDIERACALFAYAQRTEASGLLAYLVTLKIKRPDLFGRLLNNEWPAHREAQDWCDSLRAAHGQHAIFKINASHFESILELHNRYGKGTANHESMFWNELGVDGNFSKDSLFEFYMREIELPLT